jgi:hypothetical protein
MGTDNIQVLVGLDAITDYSENFKDGKEDLYDVLNEVKENRDSNIDFSKSFTNITK